MTITLLDSAAAAKSGGELGSARRNGSFRSERRLHLLLRWPPIRALDLGYAVADEGFGRIDFVEPACVVTKELRLVLLRKFTLAHGLDRPPRVVSIMMVNVGRPRQDVLVELRQTRRRCFVAFEAGYAMLEKGLARETLERRKLALIAVEPIVLVAFVQHEAQPGRGSLKDCGPEFGVALEEA